MAKPYKPDISPKPLLPVWWWLICGFFALALPTYFIAVAVYTALYVVWPEGALVIPFKEWTLEMVVRAVLAIGLVYFFVLLGIAGARGMLKLADVVGCYFMRLRQKSKQQIVE